MATLLRDFGEKTLKNNEVAGSGECKIILTFLR